MNNDTVEKSLVRGVWLWCFLSGVLPSGGVTTAIGLLSIPVGLGLRSYASKSNKVTSQSIIKPEIRDNRLQSYAITTVAGLGLYGTTRVLFRRWKPIHVVLGAFGLSQAWYGVICIMDALGASSERSYRLHAARDRVFKATMDWLTKRPSRHALIRYPLALAGSVLSVSYLMFMLVLSVFLDTQPSYGPVVRLWLRDLRLRLRTWTNRNSLFRLISKPAPHYTYQELQGQPSIRLLKLLPRRPFGGIRCELISFQLGELPDYEAVSYTWGQGGFTGMIHIDGKILPVSPTVEGVLFYLSYYTKSRYLWIDQICINQADKAEKASQVPLMRLIYRKASNVIVWLDNIKEPWKARTMLTGILHEYTFGTNPEACAEMIWSYSNNRHEAGWSQLMNIFAHPWFYRVWIIQEVVLASSVTVLASWEQLDFGNLATFVQMLMSPPFQPLVLQSGHPGVEEDTMGGLSHAYSMAVLRNLAHANPNGSTGMKMEFLMSTFSNLRSTLPVDRIYGLLGLLDPEFVSNADWLTPDYSRPAEEVFTDVAKNLLLLSPDCNEILSFAGIGYDRNLPNLPSWVPDWTNLSLITTRRQHLNKHQYASRYKASGPHRPPPRPSFSPSQPHPTTLLLTGYTFDTIAHLSPVHTYNDHNKGTGPSTPTEIISVIKPHLLSRRLANLHARNPYTTTTTTPTMHEPPCLDEAFWRTLIGNVDTARPASPRLGPACRIWERVISAQAVAALPPGVHDEELVDETNEVESVEELVRGGKMAGAMREVMQWNSTRVNCCTGRRFCVTGSGLMGMVPGGTRVGDELGVLEGVNTPFVLRRGEEEGGDGRVRLVGEAYVHGMMDGEAVDVGGWGVERFEIY